MINTDHRITDSTQNFVFIRAISAINFSDRFPLISIASEKGAVDQPNMKTTKKLVGLIEVSGWQSKGPADRNISYLRLLTTRNQRNVFNTFISSKSEYVRYKLLLKAIHEDSTESHNTCFLQYKKSQITSEYQTEALQRAGEDPSQCKEYLTQPCTGDLLFLLTLMCALHLEAREIEIRQDRWKNK